MAQKIIPADMNLQDWPITYDDLEPYYDQFEKTCGTSGKAGNLSGKKIDGGNIFEGPRKSEYPNPPMIAAQDMVMFEKAARNLGYHPFPNPVVECFAGLCQSGRRRLRRNVTIAASASASDARRMPRRARTSRSFHWPCRIQTLSCEPTQRC